MKRVETTKLSPQLVAQSEKEKHTLPQSHLSEHMANERTYLAYLRTSISLISFGVTINRFSIYLIQSSQVSERALDRWNLTSIGRVGYGMVIFGLLLLVWASVHYTHVGRGIDHGTYRPSPLITWIITIGVLLGGGISLIYLFPH
jgi:putative membrane protein